MRTTTIAALTAKDPRPWSNDVVTTTAMQRKDFRSGLMSLNVAYGEVADQLEIEIPEARQRFNDVLAIWWEAISFELSFLDKYVDAVLTDAKMIEQHDEAVNQLAVALRRHKASDIEIWTEVVLGPLRSYLRKAEYAALDQANAAVRNQGENGANLPELRLQRHTIALMVSRIEQNELSYQLRRANRMANEYVMDARRAADEARAAAGFASGKSLTKRFKVLSQKHFAAATAFRVLTAIGVALGLWVGLNVPLDEVTSGAGSATGQAILRVSLVAGVLGLATYFGRQAAYHRDVSTWASTIKEQLLTFDGYINLVDDENLRNQMRAAFAARVFGSSPESKEEPGLTLSPPMLSEVAAIFAKAGSPRP